jgi:hypothetical protein
MGDRKWELSKKQLHSKWAWKPKFWAHKKRKMISKITWPNKLTKSYISVRRKVIPGSKIEFKKKSYIFPAI